MNKYLLKVGNIFNRSIVLYLFLAGCVFLFTDYQNVINRARLSSLNRLMPAYDYIVGYMEGREPFDAEKMSEYHHYYEKVAAIVPDLPEANALYGYFSYQLGQRAKAIRSLEKAIELNPHAAHFYYDLGLIYFKQNDYARAAKFFEQAVSTDQGLNLMFILNSRIYYPMFGFYADKDDRVRLRLRQTIHSGYVLALLSYDKIKGYDQMALLASRAIQSGYDEKGEFYYFLGLAAYKLREYQKSVVFFQQCIEKNPFFEDAFHYLALGAEAMGHIDIARKASQRAEALRSSGQGYLIREADFEPVVF